MVSPSTGQGRHSSCPQVLRAVYQRRDTKVATAARVTGMVTAQDLGAFGRAHVPGFEGGHERAPRAGASVSCGLKDEQARGRRTDEESSLSHMPLGMECRVV